MTRLIPSMDLLGGQCVRLRQGRFDQVTRSDADVWRRVHCYHSSGADELHVVDLEGALSGESSQIGLISDLLRRVPIAVQVGGGVRTTRRAREYLDAGASRVVVGSLAVTSPREVESMIAELGAEKITISVDFRVVDGALKPAINGWTRFSNVDVEAIVSYFAVYEGLRFLCTDISRDGMLAGIDLTYYRQIAAITGAGRLIASGGYKNEDDLASCAAIGLHGVVVGTALFDEQIAPRKSTSC